MPKIHQLSEQVISRIAAGEVIERPVYAVKELIENSLDAGADSISIQIEGAGLKKIVVSDNGEGMSEQDLLESFKPHTTSKIDDDLVGIRTLGFRGEALSSIASISRLVLASKTEENSAGYQVSLRGGETEHTGPVGMPEGTSITISDLFSSVPARRKFLKSERTEFRQIVDLVTQYALAYPQVRFLLLHNKRVIFDLPKNQTIEDRIKKLLGTTIFARLFPIISEPSFLEIQGFVAHPQISTRQLSKQYLFVNRRAVSDKMISTAVKEAFGSLLDSTSFPVFVLFLSLPYEAVDVNVHPRKESISFVSKEAVFDAVKQSIERTLTENNLTFENLNFLPFSSRAGTTDSYAADVLRESVTPWNVKEAGKILKNSDISQIHNMYLLVQTKQGMMLVDQHAAHERILYEQFSRELARKKQEIKSFELKQPMIIDFSFADTEQILEHLESLAGLGFDIEPFRENEFRINAVPELVKDRDVHQLIIELGEQFELGKKDAIDAFSNRMISFLACRSAIMAGEKLTKDEAQRLLEKLESTENNTTCPHGRPTKIEVSVESLNKMFKRS
jgi:DNA mismatch repair protein MutL